jgi:hypothetical protein
MTMIKGLENSLSVDNTYSTKRPLFLSAVVTPYLNNAVHTPHVL